MGNCYLIKNGGIYLTPEEINDIRNFSWRPNSATEDGYVVATDGAANKVYGTDENGNPGWIDNDPPINLPEHLVTAGEDSGSEIEGVTINADSLQGFNADYFAAKDDLQDYISVEKESTFATKMDLQDYLPASEKEELATKEQLDAKANKPVTISATIPTEGWIGEDTKVVTVEVEGVTGDDTPIVDVILEGDSETKLALLSAWALILDITTNEGSITVEAIDVPEVKIPISMMVVK